MPPTKKLPKYREILQELRRAIAAREYKEGDRLPSEQAAARRFGASRLTVARAFKELQQQGIVQRRAGSGTYVTSSNANEGLVFGLLIPDLGETEIFEPVCQGMARVGRSGGHSVLWGAPSQPGESKEQQAVELCQHYISRKVVGVFFAPLELTPGMDEANQRITQALDQAGIAVVLLDRDMCKYPRRSRYDLVGIDNHRAGYRVTEHLAGLGCRRVLFFSRPRSASTVDARITGYQTAMRDFDLPVPAGYVRRGDPADAALLREILREHSPEAFVCANDRTAGSLMLTLNALGVQIPGDVRIVGIDDVKYASLLHVPLTTLRQPCTEIGAAAMSAMLERVARRGIPARDILLDCELVVRQSCGGRTA